MVKSRVDGTFLLQSTHRMDCDMLAAAVTPIDNDKNTVATRPSFRGNIVVLAWSDLATNQVVGDCKDDRREVKVEDQVWPLSHLNGISTTYI